MHLPAGRIPMCCWPSSTKLPIGWPSGLYAAPWLTEGSRRKPDCSQNVDMKKGVGGRRRKENTPDNQQLSQLQPKHTVRHCARVCGLHWLTRGMQTRIQWGPYACKHTHTLVRTCCRCHWKPCSRKIHCSQSKRRGRAVWQDERSCCCEGQNKPCAFYSMCFFSNKQEMQFHWTCLTYRMCHYPLVWMIYLIPQSSAVIIS